MEIEMKEALEKNTFGRNVNESESVHVVSPFTTNSVEEFGLVKG